MVWRRHEISQLLFTGSIPEPASCDCILCPLSNDSVGQRQPCELCKKRPITGLLKQDL